MFIGGWIADNYRCAKRNLAIDTAFQSIGYFLVAMSTMNKTTLPLDWALSLSAGQPAVPAHRSYWPTYKGSDDPRLDGAFTYLYMVNNVGSFLTMLIIPLIASMASMTLAFILCGAGMAVNVTGLLMMRGIMRDASSAPDHAPVFIQKYGTFLFGALVAVGISAYLLTNLTIARSLMPSLWPNCVHCLMTQA